MPQKTKITRKINGTTKAELVELLIQRLQPKIKAHLESWLDVQLLDIAIHKPDANPFAIRYADYTRLSEDEERELQEKIYMENYDWIESELARRKAKWMIVSNGRVVRSSRTLDNIPTQPQLDQLGKKKGFVQFLFVRNALIEEALATDQNATNWSRVSTNWYSIQKFKIGVHLSPEKIRTKTITVRVVRNWGQSPFKIINPNRKALIGRNLLLELLLKILLDGQGKITKILG